MAQIKAHYLEAPDYESKDFYGHVHPASQASVDLVLAQSEEGMDGRSNWVWVRLPNGDLVLGVYPQGDTYFEVEDDAQYKPT